MKHIKIISQCLLIFVILNDSAFSQPAESLRNSSYAYVKSNLEFLASDELEGREATTRGEKLASLYLSKELEKYGILPFGDNGSYFQEFTMVVSSYSKNSSVVFLYKNGTSEELLHGSDIVYFSRSPPSKNYYNKEFDLVFAGYGIFSEDDNYDSYDDLEVKGKVVLVLGGTPRQEGNEILGDKVIQKYRRGTAKIDLAKTNGAAGIIFLPRKETLMYWSFLKRRAFLKSYNLEEEIDTSENKNNIPTLILNRSSSLALLENEDKNYNDFMDSVNPKPEPFQLKTKVKFNCNIIIENKTARNVIGLIKGSDENLKNEYLSIGAHYDHEGAKGKNIYNGADDNGSGTVTILEVARKLALDKENKRPVIVAFHTGEEKGLKGSKYLTNHSEFIDNTIMHVNIDMVGRKSEDSIYCIGASKISSELGNLVRDANNKSSKFFLDYKFDDPNDPQRLYYRSDHINYARKGIPIAFFYDHMLADYHKPSDTIEKINFNKIVRMSEFIYQLVLQVSNLDHKLSADRL